MLVSEKLDDARGHVQILVCDDDRTMRILLRKALEADGYEVTEAHDGHQALRKFKDAAPDIVLMDAAMPALDGFETCSKLRTAAGGEHTPVLMITALNDDESMERAFGAGATDYITKPVNWTILRQRVRRMIGERQAEKRINFLAYHDALTGLPNRTLFMERLEQALIESSRRSCKLALLFLDLDGFKLVNDTLGHDAGDLLLKIVAGRLRRCLREDDTVARLGGDEFTIVLQGIEHNGQPSGAATRVLEALSHPVSVKGREIFVGASIGIAMYPADGRDAVTLLKNADTAMYRAKEHGRNTYQFYTPDMGTQVLVRMSLETSIRRALKRDEFTIHYQPVVDLGSGALVCAEALVRWEHPELGLVPPAQFIGLAEETGLIKPLGRWVLRNACQRARQWQSVSNHPLRVAVNLSGKQFGDHHLVENIHEILQDVGLSPALLELEITENTVMQNSDNAICMIGALKQLGIRVSVDDFGTGYSSLSCLKRLPLDALKVDRSFVGNIPADPDDSAIVKAIVAMAHSLRLGVVAEGVETGEQIDFLRAQGCDLAQGYYVGRPMPGEQFAEMLRAGRSLIPLSDRNGTVTATVIPHPRAGAYAKR